MTLREQYFAALKQSQRAERLDRPSGKQLVSKSIDAPQIVTIRDATGQVIGFGPVERISPAEIARVEALPKTSVSKSALPAKSNDPNAIFDDLFAWCEEPDERSEVAKSASRPDENALLDQGFFPAWLRSN